MKKMRNALCLLLALCLALALCACGEKNEAPAETETPAKTELPAKSDLPAKTDKPAQTEKPAETEKPAKTDKPAKPAKADDSIVGYYRMTENISDGEAEDLEELEETYGLIYYMVLEEGGTGYTDLAGEKEAMQWDAESFFDEETEPTPYTYDDGVITVEMDEDNRMVFTRLTDEELAYYLEHGSEPVSGGNGGSVEGEGAVGDYYVEFLGAEGLENDDGEPAIRVWYRFENDSDEVISPLMALNISGEQDGDWLTGTYLYEDVPEADYETLGVAPGCDIVCARLYLYDPDGGTIQISVWDWFDGEVVYTLDPDDLPGAPDIDFAPEYYFADTGYLDDCSDADDNLEILEAEGVEDWDGEPAILVHFRYTNNGDDTSTPFIDYNYYALQDGIGLEETNSETCSGEQDNYLADVAPGESIEFAVVFLLRTDSPIAVACKELFTGDSYIGCFFYPAD